MEARKLSGNVTMAGLRRLREALRKIVGEIESVNIGVSLWDYVSGGKRECIEVYRSEGGPTEEFLSLKDAYKYLEEIRKEVSSAATADKADS